MDDGCDGVVTGELVVTTGAGEIGIGAILGVDRDSDEGVGIDSRLAWSFEDRSFGASCVFSCFGEVLNACSIATGGVDPVRCLCWVGCDP